MKRGAKSDVVVSSEPLVVPIHCVEMPADLELRVYGRNLGRASTPLVVYFHGGLFNCGSVADADGIARALSTDAVVVCVGYPLAPRLHFPKTVEVAGRALDWAATHAADYGADATRVFVAGDQAGGNLAAVAAMMARDRGLPAGSAGMLRGQILITPMLDPMQTSASMRADMNCPCRQSWLDYLPLASDAAHPYAAPVHSKRLARLAPALVITAELDALRDEGECYAEKLDLAKVPVRVSRLANTKGNVVAPQHPRFAEVAHTVAGFIADLS